MQDHTDDKSILVQATTSCRQATSHYLKQCWLIFVTPYSVTRPHWLNAFCALFNKVLTHLLVHQALIKALRVDVMQIWRRHQMETFSALLAICAGNSPVTGEFSSRRQVTRSFDIFFDIRLNRRLSKQPWSWWFETPSRPLWCHCNVDDVDKCVYLISL